MSDKAFRDYFIRKLGGYSILKMAKFDESTNKYESDLLCDYTLGFLDGSLVTFQEQQKRIKELESKVTDLSKNLKDRELAVLVRQERIDRAIILLKSIRSENDLWGCDQVDVQIDLLEQALKGGDE